MKLRKYIVLLLILALINNLLLEIIYNNTYISYELLPINDEKVRNLHIDADVYTITEAAKNIDATPGEFITVLMAVNNYCIDEDSLKAVDTTQYMKLRNRMVRFEVEEFEALCKFYSGILEDLKYFPIPKSVNYDEWISFVDSWGYERTYGGQRRHEGTDIMAVKNVAGVYPVLAVSDGVVESMGWLELGGYRIGIRSDSGLYYYYAHMDSYAEGLEVGDSVTAGEFMGFMGNTGYSKVEGTRGKFDVHLHFGLYYDCENVETSYNPYFILKNLGENVLYYSY